MQECKRKVKQDIKTRVLQVARHIIQTKHTIRKTAALFGVSKSTVHIDLSKRLQQIDFACYEQVKQICFEHFENKHILGGMATKQKAETRKSQTKVS